MLSYWNEVVSDGLTYSVDMVTLRGSFPAMVMDDWTLPWSMSIKFLDAFVSRLHYFEQLGHWDSQHFDSFSFLSYRDMWTVTTSTGVAKFFFGFQGYQDDARDLWKIQFNPNKLLPNDGLVSLVRWVCDVSKKSSPPSIASVDVAVDLACARSYAFMVKDERKYQLVMNSTEDKTEYLGCRGKMGFCKLYNKSLEAQLSEPLTRFEITLDFGDGTCVCDLNRLRRLVPIVWVLRDQLTLDASMISGSDLVILRHCLQYPDALSLLGRRKKQKVSELISRLAGKLDLDFMIWVKQIYDLRELLLFG